MATIRKHVPKAKLIWATTTPVRVKGNLSQFAARTERVKARNELAEGIVTKEGIAVDDLFALVKDHPAYWSNDGVHFNGTVIAAQAEQVSKSILAFLKWTTRKRACPCRMTCFLGKFSSGPGRRHW